MMVIYTENTIAKALDINNIINVFNWRCQLDDSKSLNNNKIRPPIEILK